MNCEEFEILLTAHNARQTSKSCPCTGSCCATFVVVVLQQPTQQLVTNNFVQTELPGGHWQRALGIDGHVAEPLVGPELVIVGQPAFENMRKSLVQLEVT
jgi:hypothetical protein